MMSINLSFRYFSNIGYFVNMSTVSEFTSRILAASGSNKRKLN